MSNLEAVLILICIAISYLFYTKKEKDKRLLYIDNYNFPKSLNKKLKTIYPHLSNENIELIYKGMKEYFKLYVNYGRRTIVVPSKIIHRTWYEFTLEKEYYALFCKNTFEQYLYITTLESMEGRIEGSYQLKIVWTLACHQEGIDKLNIEKIPLIFFLDSSLNIPEGIKYTLNESDILNFNVKNIGFLALSDATGGKKF